METARTWIILRHATNVLCCPRPVALSNRAFTCQNLVSAARLISSSTNTMSRSLACQRKKRLWRCCRDALQPSSHFNVYDVENILLNRRCASHTQTRTMGGIIYG